MARRDDDAVREAIARARDPEGMARAGILFHGTCEPFDDDPRASPYDGVFWTARSPQIAQGYIPVSGASVRIFPDSGLALEDPIRPEVFRDGDLVRARDVRTRWALERCGADAEALDADFDPHGRLRSWRIPPGWPRGSDFDAFLRDEAGYGEPGAAGWHVSLDRGRVMPAGWRMPGRLIILLLPAAADVAAADWSTDSAGVLNHNRLADFGRMARAGRDAFRMGDALQSRTMGNYGHESVGLLPAGLEEAVWTEIPAVNYDGFHTPGDRFWTPETESFVAECASPEPETPAM